MSLRRSASNGTFETIKTLNLHTDLRAFFDCLSDTEEKNKYMLKLKTCVLVHSNWYIFNIIDTDF